MTSQTRRPPCVRALLLAMAALSLLSSAGCYTVFRHPGQRVQLDPGHRSGARPVVDYYPYSPTVWDWYSRHYGDYWSYYACPGWLDHDHYYPTDGEYAPPPPRASGFGRGGRGGRVDVPRGGESSNDRGRGSDRGTRDQTPPGNESAPAPDPADDDDKPKSKTKKPTIGGRGGRR